MYPVNTVNGEALHNSGKFHFLSTNGMARCRLSDHNLPSEYKDAYENTPKNEAVD
jgi:hypothetical protein